MIVTTVFSAVNRIAALTLANVDVRISGDENSVLIDQGIAITPTVMGIRTIAGIRNVPGYRVEVERHTTSANHMEPDDVDVEELCETQDLTEAVEVALCECLKCRIRSIDW